MEILDAIRVALLYVGFDATATECEEFIRDYGIAGGDFTVTERQVTVVRNILQDRDKTKSYHDKDDRLRFLSIKLLATSEGRSALRWAMGACEASTLKQLLGLSEHK
jgi:hypothetical protein